MEQIFFILFLIAVGYGLKYCNIQDSFGQSLNTFVIYISLPATVLLQIPKINFDMSLLLPLVMPWVVLGVSVFLVLSIFKHESRNTKAALLLLIPLGNTSFFGFPMLEAVLGSESLKYAIIYDQFGTFLILTTYGSFIVASFQGQRVNPTTIVRKILYFPPFIVLLFALIFGEMPLVNQKYLKVLADTLVPLALISVGFSMQLRVDNEQKVFIKALLLKLVIIPVIVFIGFKIAGFEGLIVQTTLLEVAMPPMITAGALAINAGFSPKLSASLVGYGIVFGTLSVSIFSIL